MMVIMKEFKVISDYKPCGDQPKAIERLSEGIIKGEKHQTLLGVTGSGKTFTMANVIEKVKRPTLVIAHNKTLVRMQTALRFVCTAQFGRYVQKEDLTSAL